MVCGFDDCGLKVVKSIRKLLHITFQRVHLVKSGPRPAPCPNRCARCARSAARVSLRTLVALATMAPPSKRKRHLDHVKLQKQWKRDFEEESDSVKCLRLLPSPPVSWTRCWTRWVDNSSSDSRREIWTFADDEVDDDEEDDTYDDGEPDYVAVVEDLVRARRRLRVNRAHVVHKETGQARNVRGQGNGRSTCFGAAAKRRNNAIPPKGTHDLRSFWSAKKDVEDVHDDDYDQLPDYHSDSDSDDEDNLHAVLNDGALDKKERTDIKVPPLPVALTDEEAYERLLAKPEELEFMRHQSGLRLLHDTQGEIADGAGRQRVESK